MNLINILEKKVSICSKEDLNQLLENKELGFETDDFQKLLEWKLDDVNFLTIDLDDVLLGIEKCESTYYFFYE